MADSENSDRKITGYKGKDLSLTINGETIDFSSVSNKAGVQKNEIGQVLQYIRDYGELPKDKSEIGSIATDGTFDNVLLGINEVLEQNGLTLEDIANDSKYGSKNTELQKKRKEQNNTNTDSNSSSDSESNYNSKAFDQYYLNAYDKNKEGTLSNETYNNLLQAEINTGQNAMDAANLQTQKLAMDQAKTVKSITDSLRAERMAMLRSGMSESQIANQDMQTLMNNTNALNQQIMQSNAQAFAGQQQINDAQTNAYNNWLNQMNQVAQVGSTYSATGAGDIITQAQRLSLINGKSVTQNVKELSGQNNK